MLPPTIFHCDLMNLPLTTLAKPLGMSPNNFHSLIGFLLVNCNDMFTFLVLWFSQALKFLNYDIIITTTMINLIRDLIFLTQRQTIFVLLCRKTFSVVKIHFTFHKSLKVSQSFEIFMKVYVNQMNIFS